MAISTKSTKFLASPVTQKVVNDIYTGRVIFSIAATRSVLADNYKHRSIQVYNWRDAPFLDHYRLRVPKYGAILEFLNFAVLLLTFILCLSNQNPEGMNFWESVFILFAVCFALEEYTASTEHGWGIYIANMWNVFDTAFLAIFCVYLVLRIRGIVNGDSASSELAFDILACGACILLPRLAFFAVSNTVVVLALRAMIAEFIFFIGIASICFSGLLFTLWTLAFIILKPASWIISPRALHSLNVFLIKLTSFPILLVIGIYERYLARGRALRESGKDAAHSIFNSLPRQIKNLPLIEALVGSTTADIYEAIFDVEAENDAELFTDSDDDEAPALRSFRYISNPTSPTSTQTRRRPASLAPSVSIRRDPSPLPSPQRLRPISSDLDFSSSGEVPTQNKSPLARLFVRTPSDNPVSAAANSVEVSVRKVETLVSEMKGLPLGRVREEMKELQDRQARIENLLLTLTRGMRQSDLDRSH
ncbi:hypothetical protein HHX47_DHR1000713 [Lentinula edodes]|nr:hypothetical protein HHX47_DHR1000713 [Lentinula edodes]